MTGECDKCFEHPVDCKCNDAPYDAPWIDKLDKSIKQILMESARIICFEDLKEHEFEFARNSIIAALRYLEDKRSQEQETADG